ncbi:Carbohydrate-binding domain, family 9 [Phytophthora cinnamomi]|uniref:Carbohydrate-binding domain, family 9 n=1 Tax=Phytophthora cinnamomi TaxID=4785 RepID=UPI00355A567F|nr:Carbohydrate-binding domain, family 9 [Phytophthora cinnamomi]
MHPHRYAAYHLPPATDQLATSITVDGVLDEKEWSEVPWSEPFQDIQGPHFWSQPWFATKFKLRYDQQFLYVGAYLEETEVWANVSKRNEVIFHDNDFEVFVDADGSTHNYKEFELNARNATWNLWLNRPYRDGGHENSTRVDPHYGFDMLNSGMRSAVFVKGDINDPAERLHYWTTEIALPLSELALHSNAQVPPAANSFWRINFSRVEWSVRVVTDKQTGKQHYEKKPGFKEENWVWSAQNAVDMHRPEWWGYLQFRPRDENPPALVYDRWTMDEVVPVDPEWGVRYVSFQYYYAQHAYRAATGTYTTSLEQLLPYFSSREAIECTKLIDISITNNSFSAQIGLREKYSGFGDNPQYVANIEDDGHIDVEKVELASPIAAIM